MRNSPAGMPLTEKEELLLIKFTDNECGFFDRLIAKRLIAKNSSAAEFVKSLNVLSDEFSVTEYGIQDLRLDLWDRISKRIDQEEKAEFYLGTRDSAVNRDSKAVDWSRLNWGISSGLVAAGLAVFFLYPGSVGSGSVGSGSAINPLPSANINMAKAGNITPVKLDWVRSHGKVRMIKDSSATSPMIWVNRSLPVYNSRPNYRSSSTLTAPNQDLFDLDENTLNTPIMLDDKAPKTIGVSGKGGFSNK